MKKIYRLFASAALLVVVLTVCIVPAYADPVTDILWGIIEWSVTPESTWEDEDLAVMLRKMWPSSIATDTIKISYDELQELCTSLNMAGYPCHISRSNIYYAIVGEGNVTGLGFTFSIENRFCANTEGHVFVAETNTNVISALNIIGTAVQNAYDRLNTLVNTLAMQDPLEEWLKLFHAQIEVVQLRQELANVQLDELIEAVNGISISADGATINLDTLPIVNKLDDVITAIEDISINVEGSTIDFDTNPITNKLDEVITAINSISVTGGGSCVHEYDADPLIDSTCTAYGLSLFRCRICNHIGTMIVPPVAHTWEFSDQTTYRTFLPLRSYDYTPRSDARSEWALIDSFWPVVDEWYQVIYNGVEYYVQAWNYGGREFGNVALGNRNYVHDDTTVTETTYPFTIVWSGLEEFGAGWVELRSFTQEPFTLSIAKLDTIPICSVCGKNEDTVSLVGAIEHATAVLQSAILSVNGDPAVSGDYSDLISSLESISAKLEQNHDDLCFGLSDFFDWVATESLIAPCEHSFMPVVMMEPSCGLPGVTKFTCDYCGTFRMEISEPLGHEWEEDAADVPEVVEPVVLLDNAPFGLIDGSSPPMLGNYQLITLVPGEMYTVIYNGTEYVTECVSAEYSGLTVPVIGNVEAYYGTGSNGLPFIITSAEALGGSGCIDLSGATLVYITIYEGTFPSDTEEEEPSAPDPFRVCSRCDNGRKFATLMAFLDERLVPGSGSGGSIDVSPVVDKLTSIENALSNLGGDVNIENNTNIEVSEDNDNYNIFYVDDPDGGDDQSIVDLSGDALKVFGKLLNFLYQVGFKDALDGAGPGIGDFSDFYLDNAEGSADLWVS